MDNPELLESDGETSGDEESQALRNMELAKAGARRAKLYFADFPKLYERYCRLRKELLGLFRNITTQAHENGRGIYLHALRFEGKMRVHINDFLLSFFSILGIKENLAVQRVFLQRIRIPSVKVASREMHRLEVGRHGVGNVSEGSIIDLSVGEDSLFGEGSRVMLLHDSLKQSASYQYFEEVVTHEVIHAMVDIPRFRHQKALGEGVTHLITQLLLEKKEVNFYEARAEVAKALMELDRDMLFSWYVGRDDDAFQTRLEERLQQYHSLRDAAQFAFMAANLSATEQLLLEWVRDESGLDRNRPDFDEIAQQSVDRGINELADALRKR